ncbi:MAG: PliI family lysozyme inhibitor of I-type lysozyme [Cyanobium sp.]
MSYPPLRPALGVLLVSCGCLLASVTAAVAAPYQQTLELQGVTFRLKAVGAGSSQQLTVQAERNGKPLAQEQQKLDGTVVGAEVEDLNGDGLPELFIYAQSAGSGSYGSVWAWSVSRRGSLLPIRLGAMSSRDSSGYRGHDKFAVVENNLVRRFPIYLPGDSNARPSGGTRQVTYKLIPGEATGQLQPVNSIQY